MRFSSIIRKILHVKCIGLLNNMNKELKLC